MELELLKTQKKVMNKDGRVSIVGSKIWNDPKQMSKYGLTLVQSAQNIAPVAVNLTEKTVNIPTDDELKAKLIPQFQDVEPVADVVTEAPELNLTNKPEPKPKTKA